MSNAIEIKNLKKKYDNNFELGEINLEIPSGYIIGLIGENGAGKTTLIKSILNITKPESGEIKIFDKNNKKYESVIKEDIGVVLDGMFFSVITGTPCIAMSNINGKVQGAYKWIDFLDYIKFADSVDEMETKLNELDLNKQYEYRVSDIYDKYDELINCIKSVSIKIQSH